MPKSLNLRTKAVSVVWVLSTLGVASPKGPWKSKWMKSLHVFFASNKILLWGLLGFASCWNSCGNCQSKTCVVRRFTFIFWSFVFSATSSNVHPAQLTLSPIYNHQTKYENFFFKKWLWPPIIICKNSCNSFKMWQCDWKYSNTHVMTSLFFWLKVGIFFTLEE
jgi:hypothetical protein